MANVTAVGLPGAHVLVRDARLLPSAPAPAGAADVCLVDPPYDWPAAQVRVLLAALLDSAWLADDAIVVVERPTRDPEDPLPATWPEPRRRVYGDTVLWYGRSVGEAGERPEKGSA
jgi:16S rRNA (guanine966-N2)-methyltransferase